MDDFIFSLDIGTRKIAAFITQQCGNNTEVIDFQIREHKSRAVRAGQIHDVGKVAEVVKDIKLTLERNNGIEIKKAGSAIAGRNLKCYRSDATIKFDSSQEITSDELRQVELAAIQSVMTKMGNDISEYYFAGHTVIMWEIDDEKITNPLGHFTQKIKVELIATFLKKKVLESLFAVAKKVDLEISFLTLEPIAATDAILPEDIRHVPVVLVDIGAGTSDIAFINSGSIQNFAMIPLAGDSITESLCNELFIDFNEAEKIKRHISAELESNDPGNSNYFSENKMQLKNIFGVTYEKSLVDLYNIFEPAIKNLAKYISDEIRNILKTSETAVKNYAVVLVGGGSLTPKLSAEIATLINIPQEHIGIRTPSMAGNIMISPRLHENPEQNSYKYDLLGPQSAVGLGISSLSKKYPSIQIMHVAINEKRIELLNFKGIQFNVLSVLLASDITKQQIYGKPGMAKTFTVNGKLTVLKGGLPVPAKIMLNGKPAGLDEVIKEGDVINFTPAINGQDFEGKIESILPSVGEYLYNSQRTIFPVEVEMNNISVTSETLIQDRAQIQIKVKDSLGEVLFQHGIDIENLKPKKLSVDLLGQKVTREVKEYLIIHNGQDIHSINVNQIKINPLDSIEVRKLGSKLMVGDLLPTPQSGRELRVKINNEEVVFPGSAGKVLLNGREVNETHVVNDGDIVRTVAGRDAEAILVDIFKYISIDPNITSGKKLKMFVNQREASFATPLSPGADVKVTFE